jgi:hypothetical protein
MSENADTPEHSLNWKRATMLIWEADDSELALIIQLVTEFEQHYGRTITAAELRTILQRPAW